MFIYTLRPHPPVLPTRWTDCLQWIGKQPEAEGPGGPNLLSIEYFKLEKYDSDKIQ